MKRLKVIFLRSLPALPMRLNPNEWPRRKPLISTFMVPALAPILKMWGHMTVVAREPQ